MAPAIGQSGPLCFRSQCGLVFPDGREEKSRASISMRLSTRYLLLAASLALTAFAAAPNLVLILADDLGYVPLRGDILKKAKAAVAKIGA